MGGIMGYRLKQFIGVGTFAEVWHAGRVDEEGKRCATDVALKIGLCHEDDERTQREREALYQTLPLQHEGTIKIIDISMRNERLIVAMELAEVSLLGLLRQGLSVVECVGYIEQVAATLDDLHRQQIVHGGINPTDILVCDGRAKIADFGPIPCDTATPRIPFYKAVCMAPELRQGEARPESDQYALAATYAWLRLQLSAFPIPRRGELPGEIDFGLLPQPEKQILLTASDRQPEQRFHSCSAFVEALQQVI